MRVETTQYEASHGKAPKGRGGWMFSFLISGHWTAPVHVGFATYAEARKEAVRRAARAGASVIRVCP